jgi:hypothetical protein
VTIFARVKLNAEVPMDLSGVYFVGGSPANEKLLLALAHGRIVTFPLASKPQSLRPFLISKALGVSPAVAREESESNLVPNPILVRQPRCAISSRCRKWKLAKPESGL